MKQSEDHHRESCLRATLAGEYFAMLACLYFGFATIGWTGQITKLPVTSVGLLFCCLWGLLRSSWRWDAGGGTIAIGVVATGLVVAAIGTNLQATPLWIAEGPFSPSIPAALSGVIWLFDLCDFNRIRGHALIPVSGNKVKNRV